jgi:nucleoside-diphosphate-sugar epimerase
MSKVLVTGGTGFIGSAIVKRLHSRGHFVKVLDNNFRGNPQNLLEIIGQIDLIEGDIRKFSDVEYACRDVDIVIHAAYINGTKHFYTKPYEILEIANKGIQNLLDSRKLHPFGKLILLSSSEVYGDAALIPTPETIPLMVSNVLNPRFSYGGGKIFSELLAINYQKEQDISLKIIRPHNIYGPNMGSLHVIPEFINKILELADTKPNTKPRLKIQGSGEETRSFCYIDDFIDGFIRVMETDNNEIIYNIGTTDEISIHNLAVLIAKIVGIDLGFSPEVEVDGSPKRRCPDITKIEALGFKPKVSLEDGIKRILALK